MIGVVKDVFKSLSEAAYQTIFIVQSAIKNLVYLKKVDILTGLFDLLTGRIHVNKSFFICNVALASISRTSTERKEKKNELRLWFAALRGADLL